MNQKPQDGGKGDLAAPPYIPSMKYIYGYIHMY